MTEWNQIADPAKRAIRVIVPATGETTDNYVDAVDLDTRWLTETIITIANSAASNELDYKILVYNDYANGTAHTITSNTVAVSDSDQVILVRHARVKVQVKSTVADNAHATDYKVDVIAGRG